MPVFEFASVGDYGIEKSSLYASCTTKSPENACQSKHQLALHGRFNVIVGNHRSFEGSVISRILERCNDGLGGEAVTHGIAARMLFAFGRCRPVSYTHLTLPTKRIV